MAIFNSYVKLPEGMTYDVQVPLVGFQFFCLVHGLFRDLASRSRIVGATASKISFWVSGSVSARLEPQGVPARPAREEMMDLPFGNQTWLAGQSPTSMECFLLCESHRSQRLMNSSHVGLPEGMQWTFCFWPSDKGNWSSYQVTYTMYILSGVTITVLEIS